MNETQEGTSLRKSASLEPPCVKSRRRVYPKRGINKNNLVIFHPFAHKPPVDGCAPNLAKLFGSPAESPVTILLVIG